MSIWPWNKAVCVCGGGGGGVCVCGRGRVCVWEGGECVLRDIDLTH